VKAANLSLSAVMLGMENIMDAPLTEKQKMLAGELYDASAAELVADRAAAEVWMRRYNETLGRDDAARYSLLRERFAAVGDGAVIRPPFHCDYGYNIRLGPRVFLNCNCVILDVVDVTIGKGTQIDPAVQIYAADHPPEPTARRLNMEFGRPIAMGSNVWIGGTAIILPGVKIGDDVVIGAGSVVTRDVPAGAVAMGNPARIKS
jgi:maltose O-acetyltransferase